MATFSSFAAFEQELARLQKDIAGAEKQKITRRMAEQAQRIAEAEASSDLGGDPKFSGWAPTLDTEIKFTTDNAAIVHPTRSSAGPWTVAEFGRNSKEGPRLVGPRLTKTGRISRARQKRWNGRTDGKNTASKAVQRMEEELPNIAEDGFTRLLQKHFDVT
jgi:hypothetical protein